MTKKLQNIITYAALTFSRITSIAARATTIVAATMMCVWLDSGAHASQCGQASGAAVDSIEVQVLFPIGRSTIDLAYQQNGERHSEFVERIRQVNTNPSITPTLIRIKGYSSPDGSYKLNMLLASERADHLASYLRTRIDMPDSLIEIESVGIDWEGLYHAVGESTLPNKAMVQDIIQNEPEFSFDANNVLYRSRKQQHQNLDGGRTWKWMMENLYPALRSSASVVCYIESQETRVESQENLESQELIDKSQEVVDVSVEIVESQEERGKSQEIGDKSRESRVESRDIELPKYPVIALRSNLLLPLLNIGAEVPLGNRWSIGADYYYPWLFRKADHKNCFQLTFVSAEARYWFGSNHSRGCGNKTNRMLGHSVAAYGAWGYFDFEHNYRGHQGHFWSFGMDYVYAMSIFKGKMHLEFQVAVGAILSHSQPYDVKVEGGNPIRDRFSKKKFSYYGPTKVGISLVLPINTTYKTK